MLFIHDALAHRPRKDYLISVAVTFPQSLVQNLLFGKQLLHFGTYYLYFHFFCVANKSNISEFASSIEINRQTGTWVSTLYYIT